MTLLGFPFRCKLCRQLRLTSLLHTRAYSTVEAKQELFKRAKSKKVCLPSTPARTRFAPSPTGYLHIGGLRTALYNYLLARATGGQFILRIEDTDQSRTVAGAEEALFRDLRWAGLSWDEGPDVGGDVGPYRQSDNLAEYQRYAAELITRGRAFRCFCTPAQLQAHAELCHTIGQPATYPGTCLALDPTDSERRAEAGEPHTIRFSSPYDDGSGKSNVVTVYDEVHGAFSLGQGDETLARRILVKSDGHPTYHFANVIDDHRMRVTHVVRGAEWLISTPFHVALYEALGWRPPAWLHVCLLTDADRQKLSKRTHDVGIASFRDRAVLPDALLNFCALAGWHPGPGTDVMTLDDMVRRFAPRFTKGDAMLDFGRLAFFQNAHMALANATVPPRKDLLGPAFVRPVMQALHDFDAKHEAYVPHNEPTPAAKTAGTRRLEPVPLGSLLYNIEGDSSKLEDRLLDILRVDGQPYQTPARFLHRHAFLIWTIPKSTLQWEYNQMRELFRGILRRPDEETQVHDGAVGPDVPADKNSQPVGGADHETERYGDPVTLVDVLQAFRSQLEKLKDESWIVGSNEQMNSQLLKSMVNKYDFLDNKPYPKYYKWGWKVLRWVLSGSAEGLPVHHILMLLGKKEALRRFDEALSIVKAGNSEL